MKTMSGDKIEQKSFDQRIESMKEQSLGEQIRGLGRLKPYLWPPGNIAFKVRSILKRKGMNKTGQPF